MANRCQVKQKDAKSVLAYAQGTASQGTKAKVRAREREREREREQRERERPQELGI